MGKCAWCGNYIADSADKQALKNFGSMTGLDLFSKPLGALIPQYCSQECKLAAQQAKGGGAAGGAGGGGGGGLGKIMSDSMAASADYAKQQQEELTSFRERFTQTIDAIHIEGSADEMASALNDCFATYQSIPAPKTGYGAQEIDREKEAARAKLLEKAEFGIMKLRKADADMADYFQKKLEELKNPPKKGLAALFGKKK